MSVWAPMMIHHEGTKNTKMHEAPPTPPQKVPGGAALWSFLSFVPSL
jgi:hypothetical protein